MLLGAPALVLVGKSGPGGLKRVELVDAEHSVVVGIRVSEVDPVVLPGVDVVIASLFHGDLAIFVPLLVNPLEPLIGVFSRLRIRNPVLDVGSELSLADLSVLVQIHIFDLIHGGPDRVFLVFAQSDPIYCQLVLAPEAISVEVPCAEKITHIGFIRKHVSLG